MNTHKFTGDMSSQVEADRDQLVEMREVLAWASNFVTMAEQTEDGQWYCLTAKPNQKAHPTLYAALHAAWSNRGKT